MSSITRVWRDYAELRRVQGRERRAEAPARGGAGGRAGAARAGGSGAEPRARCSTLRDRSNLTTVAAEIIAGGATPDFRTLTIDKGTRDGVRATWPSSRPPAWSAVSSCRARAPRRCSCSSIATPRPARSIERSRAQGVVVGARRRPVADGVRVGGLGRRRRRPRGHVGHRRHLSRRAIVIGRVEAVERSGGGVQADRRQAGRRFLEHRRSAGGADADAGARGRRGGHGVKVAGVVLAVAWRSPFRRRSRDS